MPGRVRFAPSRWRPVCGIPAWTRMWWAPSELNYSDKGSRFFYCDCDSSKSLLHVLAERSTVFTSTDMRPRLPFSLTDAPGCW